MTDDQFQKLINVLENIDFRLEQLHNGRGQDLKDFARIGKALENLNRKVIETALTTDDVLGKIEMLVKRAAIKMGVEQDDLYPEETYDDVGDPDGNMPWDEIEEEE